MTKLKAAPNEATRTRPDLQNACKSGLADARNDLLSLMLLWSIITTKYPAQLIKIHLAPEQSYRKRSPVLAPIPYFHRLTVLYRSLVLWNPLPVLLCKLPFQQHLLPPWWPAATVHSVLIHRWTPTHALDTNTYRVVHVKGKSIQWRSQKRWVFFYCVKKKKHPCICFIARNCISD